MYRNKREAAGPPPVWIEPNDHGAAKEAAKRCRMMDLSPEDGEGVAWTSCDKDTALETILIYSAVEGCVYHEPAFACE